MSNDEKPTICASCGRIRTGDDFDYNAMQVIFGSALGWYSGDDGEICGDCMTRTIRGQ